MDSRVTLLTLSQLGKINRRLARKRNVHIREICTCSRDTNVPYPQEFRVWYNGGQICKRGRVNGGRVLSGFEGNFRVFFDYSVINFGNSRKRRIAMQKNKCGKDECGRKHCCWSCLMFFKQKHFFLKVWYIYIYLRNMVDSINNAWGHLRADWLWSFDVSFLYFRLLGGRNLFNLVWDFSLMFINF